MDIGFVSYLLALAAHVVLLLLVSFSWPGRVQGVLVVVATLCSAVWAGTALSVESGASLPFGLVQLAELAKWIGWCLLLLYALTGEDDSPLGVNPLKSGYGLVFVALIAAVVVVYLTAEFAINLFDPVQLLISIWVGFTIFGLTLIEQLYRNSTQQQRWAVKYLCLGMGLVFAYDFFMYADALLFNAIRLTLWEARGAVNAMAIPLIAISIARSPRYDIDIHVSRKVVFHSATILGAGTYLLVMATVGYLIKFYGATWGGVVQIVFFAGAGALLVGIMFSDSIRARAKVLLSKHFFSYKYDYREEWQKFTHHLSEAGEGVGERLIRAVAALTESSGGMLWEKDAGGKFVLLDRWHMPEVEPGQSGAIAVMVGFMERTRWVIDIDEFGRKPEKYQGLALPEWLQQLPDAWLVVPLMFRDDCLGFVVLKHSNFKKSVEWEELDLLKMAGAQAAIHLAQFQADRALAYTRQFEAFNRLSAYVVHDLKNILAQQSLIVANAEKHKHKPEFVDDVITTVQNSVRRMTNLMKQMREGQRGHVNQSVDVAEILQEVVAQRAAQEPAPRLRIEADGLVVQADADQLATVFGHIIQNAQEATAKSGNVTVTVRDGGDHAVVAIEDTGAGMDENFIRRRLFKPFDSTKGLTGMGVGAFESREYVRSLGGEIAVSSELEVGSIFTITLPYNRNL